MSDFTVFLQTAKFVKILQSIKFLARVSKCSAVNKLAPEVGFPESSSLGTNKSNMLESLEKREAKHSLDVFGIVKQQQLELFLQKMMWSQ